MVADRNWRRPGRRRRGTFHRRDPDLHRGANALEQHRADFDAQQQREVALIESIDGASIVAEAENGREAVALAKTHSPDVVVMDISMSGLNGMSSFSWRRLCRGRAQEDYNNRP